MGVQRSPQSWGGLGPKQVFSGDDGILYAIMSNGDLMWYRHDGRDDGTFKWADAKGRKVGVGWNVKHVFAGAGGVIYAVSPTKT